MTSPANDKLTGAAAPIEERASKRAQPVVSFGDPPISVTVLHPGKLRARRGVGAFEMRMLARFDSLYSGNHHLGSTPKRKLAIITIAYRAASRLYRAADARAR